jgi:nicotinamidase-related amidase
VEDTRRAIEWLYRNLTTVTTLFLTLDSHSTHQIFHPAAWVDGEGRPPAPFTVISSRDVRERRFVPVLADSRIPDMRAACIEYCERLEGSGRHALTIWPYHAFLGGASHALVPALMEAVLFHSLVRRADPVFEIKGRASLTESYSALSPEVRSLQGHALGGFNHSLYDAVMSHDRVYVFGQAKSHCVLETLRDLRQECERRDPRLLERLYVLEDAMSPVTPPPLDPLPEALDFPRVAERALDEFRRAGMHVVRTSEPIASLVGS